MLRWAHKNMYILLGHVYHTKASRMIGVGSEKPWSSRYLFRSSPFISTRP